MDSKKEDLDSFKAAIALEMGIDLELVSRAVDSGVEQLNSESVLTRIERQLGFKLPNNLRQKFPWQLPPRFRSFPMIALNHNPSPPPPVAKSASKGWLFNAGVLVVGAAMVLLPLHLFGTYVATETWFDDGVIYRRSDTHRITDGKLLKSELIQQEVGRRPYAGGKDIPAAPREPVAE